MWRMYQYCVSGLDRVWQMTNSEISLKKGEGLKDNIKELQQNPNEWKGGEGRLEEKPKYEN